MDELKNLLNKYHNPTPPEIKAIKKFVKDRYDSDVAITMQAKQIIISCNSAALAGTLRMHTHELSELCKTDKRLVFRVGS